MTVQNQCRGFLHPLRRTAGRTGSSKVSTKLHDEEMGLRRASGCYRNRNMPSMVDRQVREYITQSCQQEVGINQQECYSYRILAVFTRFRT